MKFLLPAVTFQKTAAFLLIGLALAACGKKTETLALPPVKVNVVKAIQNDVPLYEDFVAQVYGESDVDIRSRVEGWITSVNFKEGSAVKKGDLLYTIDDIQYKTRVDREASELASAKTEMVRAQNELNRVKPLAEMNALSKQDLDNSTAAYEAAVAKVKLQRLHSKMQKLNLAIPAYMLLLMVWLVSPMCVLAIMQAGPVHLPCSPPFPVSVVYGFGFRSASVSICALRP